jgi:hypothetical protein
MGAGRYSWPKNGRRGQRPPKTGKIGSFWACCSPALPASPRGRKRRWWAKHPRQGSCQGYFGSWHRFWGLMVPSGRSRGPKWRRKCLNRPPAAALLYRLPRGAEKEGGGRSTPGKGHARVFLVHGTVSGAFSGKKNDPPRLGFNRKCVKAQLPVFYFRSPRSPFPLVD